LCRLWTLADCGLANGGPPCFAGTKLPSKKAWVHSSRPWASSWLNSARQSCSQVPCWDHAGAGLGKTTLVEAFIAQLETQGPPWIGCGQCVEHYGVGEAYLPVLEALGRLCRVPGGQELVALLGQQAPTWLVQMPGLVRAADLEMLQRRIVGATRDRMLRELAEALDLLATQQTLVLVLEDLHWSDPSTLDLGSTGRRAWCASARRAIRSSWSRSWIPG
jgi:hypothetical protein